MKNLFLILALAIGICTSVSAQVYDEYFSTGRPDSRFRIVGEVTVRVPTKRCYDQLWSDDFGAIRKAMVQEAKKLCGSDHPKFVLFEPIDKEPLTYINHGNNKRTGGCDAVWIASGTVAVPILHELIEEKMSASMDKAMKNIGKGSRIAIKDISFGDETGLDKDMLKDKIIDILLDKGYRVVAKEFLAQLYEELKNQNSPLTNPDTYVEENNFSAVGYYFNLKVSTTSMRVQLINVSTGEYEGNVTVNF